MENKDKWEKLVNTVNEDFKEDENLARKATVFIAERQNGQQNQGVLVPAGETKSGGAVAKKRVGLVALLALLCVAVIALSIFLPVYFANKPSAPVYFDDENLTFEVVADLGDFVQENELDVYCFKGAIRQNCQVARTEEDQKLAYIEGDYMFLGATAIDNITLRVVLLNNATFDFVKDYNKANLTTTVGNIAVGYSTRQTLDNNIIIAKFTVGKYSYYLEISTYDQVADKLESYINLLVAN